MRKVLFSIMTLVLVVGLVGAGALAVLKDTETSNDNMFAAGSIDLTVNGNNGTNTVLFNQTNMRPGNQLLGSYVLNNTGTLPGYLDIENIVVTQLENTRIEPEIEAGDTTDAVGEFGAILGYRMFIDNAPADGWFGAEDVEFYNSTIGALPGNFDLDKQIPAGGSVKIAVQVNWWDTANDSKAMTDSVELDMTFELLSLPD